MMREIQESILWVDEHSGSAMVVLTLVYVVATLVILREQRKTNRISETLERTRNRPFVVFYVECRDRCFYAVLKNFGRQPAFDVQTTIEPDITRKGGPHKQLSFAESAIPMLAPGMQIEDFIEVTHSYLQRAGGVSHTVTVRYKDSFKTAYGESIPVSFQHYRNRRTARRETAEDKMARAWDGAERALRDLATSASQLKWTINNTVNRPFPADECSSKENGPVPSGELSEDELEYLADIADPRNAGCISSGIVSAFHGEEGEKFHRMMDRFLVLGLARKELDLLVLTDRAYRLVRQMSDNGCGRADEALSDEEIRIVEEATQ